MSASSATTFLACCKCGVAQPLVLNVSLPSDAMAEDAISSCNDFLADHLSHEMVRCTRRSADSIADRPLWDPLAAITFEVTDGQQTYVVTSARQSIDEPRLYRLAHGTLTVQGSEVSLDDADLRRGLDMEFFPHALRPTKVDRLLSVMHQIVNRVDPETLAIAFDAADDPAVSIAPMPEAAYQELLTRCAEIFDPGELEPVTRFLRENRDESGLLALRIRRYFNAPPLPAVLSHAPD